MDQENGEREINASTWDFRHADCMCPAPRLVALAGLTINSPETLIVPLAFPYYESCEPFHIIVTELHGAEIEGIMEQ